jgi:hypothetical protein
LPSLPSFFSSSLLFSLVVLGFEFRAKQRQVLCCTPGPFCFSYFSYMVLHFCPDWPQTLIPLPMPPEYLELHWHITIHTITSLLRWVETGSC